MYILSEKLHLYIKTLYILVTKMKLKHLLRLLYFLLFPNIFEKESESLEERVYPEQVWRRAYRYREGERRAEALIRLYSWRRESVTLIV